AAGVQPRKIKAAEHKVRQVRSLPERYAAAGAAKPPLRGRVLLLQAKLSGGLAATPGCFLAGQVTDTQVPRIDEESPAVDQHLGLARGGLDDGGALEHGGHPDTPAVDLSLKVGQDLV